MIHAPLVNSPGIGDYLCGHNVLLANARVYRMYHNFYNADKSGKIGIVLNSYYTYPLDPQNAADVAAADQSMQFWVNSNSRNDFNYFFEWKFLSFPLYLDGMVCSSNFF